jgi:N-acylneuraminate cytidylyltransferase
LKKICIIPARGGSKRIPRKNIKLFLGQPIIGYSITAALESNLFDEVMVSTDNKEVAEIANRYGAKTPFYRSKKNSNDIASTIDVIIEVLEFYSKKGLNFEYGCCLYPTAPFAKKDLLVETYNSLIKENCNVVFPVVAYSHPVQRAFKIDNSNRISLLDKKYQFTRTQDLETIYHDSGQFYWFNTKKLLIDKNFFNDNTIGYKIPEYEAQDIDNIYDWKIAELKYKNLFT